MVTVKRLRLALFISGGGTTASSVIKTCKTGKLAIDPVLVVASKDGISGIERVEQAGVAVSAIYVVNPKKYGSAEEFGKVLIQLCKVNNIDLIGQYGWLPLTPRNLIQEYAGRIVNQHPGPLDTGRPDFGGKGMYGRRVHAAVLYFRRITKHDNWTETTTHLVTEEFDRGEVIKQKRVEILPTDTVEVLQQRTLPFEHEVQIEALGDIAVGKVKTLKREKPLVKGDELEILEEAKRIAAIYYPNG